LGYLQQQDAYGSWQTRTIRDQSGHIIYLMQERWDHITAPMNHPEMVPYEEHLKETVASGQRRQDSLNPHKY
jgi:hypothetical protein